VFTNFILLRRIRPRTPRFTTTFFVLAVTLLALSLPAAAAITAQIDGQHLRVSGATPSGSVVVVAALRETSSTRIASLDRVAVVLPSNAAGTADLDFGRPIPMAGIWAVVDQISGTYNIVTASDYPRREQSFPSSIYKHATPADIIDQLSTNSLMLRMLWVRPGNGGGSWFLTASDGAMNDDDRTPNGEVSTSTDHFLPIEGKEKPPKKLKIGDILILIDPFEMNFRATTVTR
jgi:hypothetical protein